MFLYHSLCIIYGHLRQIRDFLPPPPLLDDEYERRPTQDGNALSFCSHNIFVIIKHTSFSRPGSTYFPVSSIIMSAFTGPTATCFSLCNCHPNIYLVFVETGSLMTIKL